MTESIKFFWNGIKVNGERKLIKCVYSLDNHCDHEKCVSIYVHDYSGRLPRDLFEVHNDTDLYTDYFDEDHATLTPDHPLYKYARYAAIKAELRHLPRHIEYLENLKGSRWENPVELEAKKAKLAEYQAEKDPGHPRKSDIEAVYVMNLEAESKRIAEAKAREQAAREKVLNDQNEGRRYIEQIAGEYPIREGEPVVTIEWSENPAFYSWKDGELKLSVAAAEIILKHFDEKVHAEEDRGYDKTKFTISYRDENGEESSYEGRYDLGDNDGGMIQHIRSFGQYYADKGEEEGREIVKFADWLEQYTMAGRVVSISLAPWFENFLNQMETAAENEFKIAMGIVEKMTDEQLIAELMKVPADDPEKAIVAKFFVQQLGTRDIMKAIEAYQAWKNQ